MHHAFREVGGPGHIRVRQGNLYHPFENFRNTCTCVGYKAVKSNRQS